MSPLTGARFEWGGNSSRRDAGELATTLYPWLRNVCTIAFPMPPDAPVTITVSVSSIARSSASVSGPPTRCLRIKMRRSRQGFTGGHILWYRPGTGPRFASAGPIFVGRRLSCLQTPGGPQASPPGPLIRSELVRRSMRLPLCHPVQRAREFAVRDLRLRLAL